MPRNQAAARAGLGLKGTGPAAAERGTGSWHGKSCSGNRSDHLSGALHGSGRRVSLNLRGCCPSVVHVTFYVTHPCRTETFPAAEVSAGLSLQDL